MVHPSTLRRLFLFAALLTLIFAGLGGRLVLLQVVHHEKYREIAETQTERIFLKQARRGDILDAHGNPLAVSFPAKKVFANPRLMGPHYIDVARALAPVIRWEEARLAQALRPVVLRTNEFGRLVTNSWVDLKRRLTVEQWQQVTQIMASLSFGVDETRLNRTQRANYRNLRQAAVWAEDDQQRVYPSETLASHVLGFVQEQETNFNNITTLELEGRDGVELWLDEKLRGVPGWRVTETDRRRREIVVNRDQDVESRPGYNAMLTVDMVVQRFVEEAIGEAKRKHNALSVSAVVVRPQTGEILAMATVPDYNPNRPGDYPEDSRRNRIISDIYEPGSTFKIVVVSAGLHEELVDLNDTFFCENGAFRFMNKTLRDHGEYGTLTVEGIITKSSNIGSAKIAIEKLGERKLYDHCLNFGYGRKTGVPLPGEVRGIVNPPSARDKLAISRVPMGQAISVTSMQMAMAMSAIANGGRLMKPMLIQSLRDHDGRLFVRYEPQVVRRVISERAARDMIQALKTVVSKDGTAPKAQMEHYHVAGKTGTAQKVMDRVYAPGKYVASFIGFFPAAQPEVCIAVIVDEPEVKGGYYGGQVAAPVFRAIAEPIAKYLKLRPDREDPAHPVPPGPPGATNSVPHLNTVQLRASLR